MLVEAMASGTRVLVNKAGGPIEILENGKLGFLESFIDKERFAEKIEEVLAAPTQKLSLISRSKDFSVTKIIDEYIDLLESIDFN